MRGKRYPKEFKNGVPGDGRIVRPDWRPGVAQRDLNIHGDIHRGAVPGQDGIEAGAERVFFL